MAGLSAEEVKRVNWFLGELEEYWEHLPQTAREIDGWDLIEQQDFVVDTIPNTRSYLEVLASYAQEGLLTAEQLVRYERVRRLAQDRAALEQQIMEG